VRSQVKPKVIFWRCIDVLVREKIEVPSYTRLTKLILGAINRRSQELAAIIERSLTQEVRALLEDLLRQEPLVGDTVPGKTSAYKLTLMKKLSQSTKPSKVKERVVDLSLVRGLYDLLSPTLQSLALMPGGIRYYAESVLRSEIFQLTRRDDPDRYLHVIAFIAHQFYRLQDNLVDVLLTSLRSFQNGAIREHKEQCYARREQQHEALKTLLGGLERGLVGTLTSIGSITEDQALSDTEKVTRIRALLETRETRRLLEEDPVAELKASLVSELDEDDYYKILELKSVWIQNQTPLPKSKRQKLRQTLRLCSTTFRLARLRPRSSGQTPSRIGLFVSRTRFKDQSNECSSQRDGNSTKSGEAAVVGLRSFRAQLIPLSHGESSPSIGYENVVFNNTFPSTADNTTRYLWRYI
jgi:hypothetical protein